MYTAIRRAYKPEPPVYYVPPSTSPPVPPVIAYAIVGGPCDTGDIMRRSYFNLRIPWDRKREARSNPRRDRIWRDRLTSLCTY